MIKTPLRNQLKHPRNERSAPLLNQSSETHCYHDLALPSQHTPLLSPAPLLPGNFQFHSNSTLSRAGGSGDRKGQQPASQAEAERQQILNEMKKKTQLLTDSSWIRQRPPTTVREVDIPPMRRCDSVRVWVFFLKDRKVCW